MQDYPGFGLMSTCNMKSNGFPPGTEYGDGQTVYGMDGWTGGWMESLEGHFSMVHCSGCPGGEWEPRNRPRGACVDLSWGQPVGSPILPQPWASFLSRRGTRATSGSMQPSIDLRLVKRDNNRPSPCHVSIRSSYRSMIVLNTYRCLFRRVFVVSWFHKRRPSIPSVPVRTYEIFIVRNSQPVSIHPHDNRVSQPTRQESP